MMGVIGTGGKDKGGMSTKKGKNKAAYKLVMKRG